MYQGQGIQVSLQNLADFKIKRMNKEGESQTCISRYGVQRTLLLVNSCFAIQSNWQIGSIVSLNVKLWWKGWQLWWRLLARKNLTQKRELLEKYGRCFHVSTKREIFFDIIPLSLYVSSPVLLFLLWGGMTLWSIIQSNRNRAEDWKWQCTLNGFELNGFLMMVTVMENTKHQVAGKYFTVNESSIQHN